MKRLAVVILLALLLMVMCGCSNKTEKRLEEAELLLSNVSELLGKIEDDCDFAEHSEDIDCMAEELGITQIRCEEMKKEIDMFLLFGP